MRHVALVLALNLFAFGCASAPQLDPDTLLANVELEGDLRCEGEGTFRLFFLTLKAEGLGDVDGQVNGTGEADGAGCAGIALELPPWRWVWRSETQRGACEEPGSLSVEVADE